jgi:RNA polymerase primary sigma factor
VPLGDSLARRAPASSPPTPADQERELVAATGSGDQEACRRLVDSFLPAIAGVARRVDAGGRVQRGELMQEGIAGLLFATRRYDPRVGTPFWAYASFWVRKAMQDLVAEVTRPVALSDHAVRGLARIRAARRDHVAAHGVEPSRNQLAEAAGLNRDQLDTLLALERAPRALDEPLGAGDGESPGTLGDTIADPAAEVEYQHVLDEMEMRHLIGVLDDRERTVLCSHYGFGCDAQTLSEIGAGLRLTAERVRQIEADAFKKLREAVAQPPA